jgi:outer membrane protein assembly factor BamE (lipoprotein component of BamABCDE complex)
MIMRTIFMLALLLVLFAPGCATPKVMVKNCVHQGGVIWACEEIK